MSPDGSTKPPPEERLLKLLRGKGSPPSPAAAASPQAVRSAGTRLVARGARKQMPALGWSVIATGILGTVLLLEAVGMVIAIARPAPVIQISTVTPPPPDLGDVEPPDLSLPSMAESASRPLFVTPVAVAPPIETTKKAPSGSAKLLASRLTLLGVISGDPPQAIIEDAQTKKTYFVTTGQGVVDGAVLDQVLDNRVILDFEGEKVELSL